MKSTFAIAILASAVAATLAIPAASAATVSYTETFDSNDANWLNGDSAALTHNASGGVANSGYVSFSPAAFTTSADGDYPDAPVLKLFFRGNDSANASGDAFVGNWISSGVTTFSLTIRHNYSTSLDLYTRFGASSPPGAGASLAAGVYAVAPDTWTTIEIPIINGNPPFSSFGSSNFNGVFSAINNLQIGFYLPSSTTFSDLTIGLDNVGIVAVPEPTTFGLVGASALGLLIRRRRRTA